jgi:arginine repressor
VMPARGNPRRNRETAEVEYLRRNNALIRRSAIRRILAGRYHTNGIRNLEQLRDELKAATGIESHIMTLSRDLQMMGAIKVRDAERTLVEWWVVPAFNPNTEDLREQMDPEIVENEVAHKIASHVIDIAPIQQFVYVLTEARAGPLVGYWLSWLTWYGIVYVQEQLDGCIVHCVNDETAMLVAERLTGDKRLRPEAASDEP